MKQVFSLVTKKDCSLCVPVKFILQKVVARYPSARYEEIDIEEHENRSFFQLYKHDIPVVLFNGKEVARHRIQESLIVSILEKSS